MRISDAAGLSAGMLLSRVRPSACTRAQRMFVRPRVRAMFSVGGRGRGCVSMQITRALKNFVGGGGRLFYAADISADILA